jgi:hypothetical protein
LQLALSLQRYPFNGDREGKNRSRLGVCVWINFCVAGEHHA